MPDVLKILSLLGIVFILLGFAFNIMIKPPRIPGDIYIDRPNLKIYIPWLSSLVISVIITIMFNYFRK